jgi:hypothetical protein
MALLTDRFARTLARSRTRQQSYATWLIHKRRNDDQGVQKFDIFLSHAREDEELVCGVLALFELLGMTVYVDWIIDRELDREAVTSDHASIIRRRMQSSAVMVVLTTKNSIDSVWMPWELGYFDGRNPGKIVILPIVEDARSGFRGREFLGLYPVLEHSAGLGHSVSDWTILDERGSLISLRQMAAGKP